MMTKKIKFILYFIYSLRVYVRWAQEGSRIVTTPYTRYYVAQKKPCGFLAMALCARNAARAETKYYDDASNLKIFFSYVYKYIFVSAKICWAHTLHYTTRRRRCFSRTLGAVIKCVCTGCAIWWWWWWPNIDLYSPQARLCKGENECIRKKYVVFFRKAIKLWCDVAHFFGYVYEFTICELVLLCLFMIMRKKTYNAL